MTATFAQLATPTRIDDLRFQFEVPDTWQMGRGTFGGLVLAAMVRAGEAVLADPARPLRSLTAEIVGPLVPGPAAIAVELLRAGSGVSTLAVRMRQGDEIIAHAVLACGAPRARFELAPVLPAPTPRPWRELPVAPLGPPSAPVFTQHLEARLDGPAAFSGSDAPSTRGWVRFRGGGVRDDAEVVALIDSLWPSILARETAPRPVATLAFSFQRVDGIDGLDPEAPLYYRGRVLSARDGFAVELRELWGEDGRLVALNQQTIVIIR